MVRYKLLIEYDGTDFHGWQLQPDVRTVQGEIEQALQTVFKDRLRLSAAGRTDTGVHAAGQVAHFDAPHFLPVERIRGSLNALTGRDVVVHAVDEVDETFHARFSAQARQYFYRIALQKTAIHRRLAFYPGQLTHVPAMQEAAQCLVGSHDFRAFSKKIPGEKHYLCDVEQVEWFREGEMLIFRIRANRFLHSMIRLLIGGLVKVGKGQLSPQQFAEILHSRQQNNTIYKALANGLCLEKVYYPRHLA